MRQFLIAAIMSAAAASAATPEAREWQAPDGMVIKYRWSAPETVEPGKAYPLVLFLRGPHLWRR